MQKDLLHYLSEIPDHRRKQGMRYDLSKVLALMVIGTLAGRVGYRSIARYGKEHEAYLSKQLGFKHGTPSHVSLGAIVDGVDLLSFERALNAWGRSRLGTNTNEEKKHCLDGLEDREKVVISLDGKAVKSSVGGGNTKNQNFVMFLNAFCADYQTVLASKSYEHKKEGETEVLRMLLEELNLEGTVLTMDAYHSSKKHFS